MKKEWCSYLFVLPAVLFFGMFILFPVIQTIHYSFTRWSGLGTPQWVGFSNYFRALFEDSIFKRSFLNTFLYTGGTLIVEVLFGLVMAILLNRILPLFALYRALFFAPYVCSMIGVGILWSFIYDNNFGLLNELLKFIGAGGLMRAWLGNPSTALLAVTFVSGWKYAGFFMVIFYAALRQIPQDLYEAARLDGASKWHEVWYITLPLLRETVNVAVLICITGGIATFDLFFVMTNGQPYHTTEILYTWIIKTAFDRHFLGYGASQTIIAIITGISFGLAQLIYTTRKTRRRIFEY